MAFIGGNIGAIGQSIVANPTVGTSSAPSASAPNTGSVWNEATGQWQSSSDTTPGAMPSSNMPIDAYNSFSSNYASMGNPNGPSTTAMGPSYQDWINAGSPADYQGYVNATSSPTTSNIVGGTGSGGLSSLVNSGTTNMATPVGTNPLSAIQTGTAVGAQAPNLGVTAGSAPGAGGLTQGTALPNITTTQQQATATPQFYLDYLNQIAKQGATAAQSAQFAGAQPLQEQAFQQVGQNVGNYQPTLDSAINLAKSVGGSDLAGAIGNLGQANIAYNLAPQATAGIVGSGQFGSSRGAGALGQVLANADLAITQQQQQALQQDMANRLAASQQLGTLANSTQNLGLGDVNALATLGGQQQTIAQNSQLFPMQQLAQEAALLKGATIPTATSSSYTGPIPGAYNTSPLAQIAGVGSVLAGTGLGQSLFGSPASGNQPATTGLLGGALNGVTGWAGRTYDSLVGNPSSGNPAGTYPLNGGGSLQINSDGSQTVIGADGTRQYYDAQGNPTTVAQDLQNQNIIPAPDNTNYGGGDTSWIDNTDWSQYINPTPTYDPYNADNWGGG